MTGPALDPQQLREYRATAHRAVTEAVNLRYLEQAFAEIARAALRHADRIQAVSSPQTVPPGSVKDTP